MQFNTSKSSFNFYKKQPQHDDHNLQQKADSQKGQNLLSESSNNNADQHYSKLSNFSNSDNAHSQNRDQNDSCQQYHCITCNRTYDGLIKCRHNSHQNNQNNEPFMSRYSNNDIASMNRTYICPFDKCQKKFNLQSGLIRHKVVHTGQRPYSCDYENCAQSFNQKSNLNRHKKIHKNQKPFICQKCCKSFTTTTNLKQHSQTHIQKKQQRKIYTCQIKGCNKKYLYRCNLKKHKQQHEDPVAGCLLSENQQQKKIKKAKFQLSLHHCNISLQLNQASIQDHSEMKITYDQNLGGPNTQIYNPILMLPNDCQKQQKQNECQILSDQKMQAQVIEQNLIKNLQEFLVNKPSQISASFYMHPDLIQYSKIIIDQVITLLEQKGTKQIRFFVQTKENFQVCVQNLLSIYFNKSYKEEKRRL